MNTLSYKKNYALDDVPDELNDFEKVIYELISEAANDDNSSKFREEITLDMCNYENSPEESSCTICYNLNKMY
mgnify:CR=1 FL=1